ncbi:hypothetical protein Bca4012_099322 [Brassica carinata]|uniref:Uncharacterized protein n=1 Tax=Brassica carinata TaxID=52824 RepID=A0A8X7PJI3_BRACI|nr:hypothetical protein Bca52824_081953 [Brassica carinata]
MERKWIDSTRIHSLLSLRVRDMSPQDEMPLNFTDRKVTSKGSNQHGPPETHWKHEPRVDNEREDAHCR